MSSQNALENCDCLPDCEDITIEVKVDKFKLNPEDLCNQFVNWDTFSMAMSDWEATHSPAGYTADLLNEAHRDHKKFGADFLDYMENRRGAIFNMSFGLPSEEAVAVCEGMFRYDIAQLTVRISEPNVVEITKDVRFTFSDQIGVVGGTLGLFTGVSILSMLEALFWIYKVRN